jgi:hypothetical protein
MIKLVDLLKEIQTRPKPELGRGEQGTVYPLGKDKVVKKTNFTDGMVKTELEDYEIFNQHPDVFPHVYKLTPHYIILDKLDTSLKEFKDPEFWLFLCKNGWWKDDPSKKGYWGANPDGMNWEYDSKTGLYNWMGDGEPIIDYEWDVYVREDPFTKTFISVRKNDLKPFNNILQKAKEQGKTQYVNALKEILDFCIKINKVFKGEWRDVHIQNIGRDKNNKLKIFDVTIDF